MLRAEGVLGEWRNGIRVLLHKRTRLPLHIHFSKARHQYE